MTFNNKYLTLGFTILPLISHHVFNFNVHKKYFNKSPQFNFNSTHNGTWTPFHTIRKNFWWFHWRDEAVSWNDFYIKYPWIVFDLDSKIGVYNTQYQLNNDYIYEITPLTNISTIKIDFQETPTHKVQIYHNGGLFGSRVSLIGHIIVWHDDKFIYLDYYFSVESSFSPVGSRTQFKVNNIWFEKIY